MKVGDRVIVVWSRTRPFRGEFDEPIHQEAEILGIDGAKVCVRHICPPKDMDRFAVVKRDQIKYYTDAPEPEPPRCLCGHLWSYHHDGMCHGNNPEGTGCPCKASVRSATRPRPPG
jgi:hypothetical protein